MGREKTVVGLFGERSGADRVLAGLTQEGFGRGDISLIGPHRAGAAAAATSSGDDQAVGDGAAWGAGVAWGAGLGGVVGLVASGGVLALPGFGPSSRWAPGLPR